jgi:hypothetical protein
MLHCFSDNVLHAILVDELTADLLDSRLMALPAKKSKQTRLFASSDSSFV